MNEHNHHEILKAFAAQCKAAQYNCDLTQFRAASDFCDDFAGYSENQNLMSIARNIIANNAGNLSKNQIGCPEIEFFIIIFITILI